MTLRRALALFPRPWIDGSVTFQDWMLASSLLLAAVERDEGGRMREPQQGDVTDVVVVPRRLLIQADSYLSLLWHRPSTDHDTDLQLNIPRVIGELRTLSEKRP